MIRTLLLSLLLAGAAAADNITLISPIDCDLEGDCYIQQYVDHDPSSGVRDFACNDLSYDGHKGTDFALRNLAQMRAGVNVVAAADGVVRGMRDDMPDTGYTQATAPQIDGKECGNGIVLRHPGGWETQYCHLMQGTLQMEPGDTLKAGDVIGKVGLSGKSQFPHLHLSVRKDGKVVDPFHPAADATCDPAPSDTLWATSLDYEPAGIVSLGFADHVPSYDDVKTGTHFTVNRFSPALVISAYLFGARQGDELYLRLTGPEGEIVSKIITYDRNRALSFRAIGRKKRGPVWTQGTYSGTATLRRMEKVIDTQKLTVAFP